MLAELAVLKAKLLAGVETPECIYRQLAPFQEAFRRIAEEKASLRQIAKPSPDVVTVEEMKAYAAAGKLARRTR